jgi:hypothetical protein
VCVCVCLQHSIFCSHASRESESQRPISIIQNMSPSRSRSPQPRAHDSVTTASLDLMLEDGSIVFDSKVNVAEGIVDIPIGGSSPEASRAWGLAVAKRLHALGRLLGFAPWQDSVRIFCSFENAKGGSLAVSPAGPNHAGGPLW